MLKKPQIIEISGNVMPWIFLAFAICLGLYGRLVSLGASPLAVDEYYIAQSVRNIIAHGLPMFDCGGFYTRGLIHQYLAAAVQMSGIEPEIAVRSVSLVANIAAIPVLYMLSKKVAGREAGLIVVAIYFLSTWEIEFSRFGRMYSLFQLAFLWHAWFLLRSMSGNLRAYLVAVAISAISLLVYEAGALLLILNFVPLLTGSVKGKFPWIVSMSAIAGGFLYLRQDFRILGADSSMPGDYTPPLPLENGWALPIDKPSLLIEQLNVIPALLVVLLGFMVLAILIVTYRSARTHAGESIQDTSLCAYVWLTVVVAGSALNLFLLVGVVSLIFWLWDWHSFQRSFRRVYIIVGLWIAICLLTWTTIYWLTAGPMGAEPSLKEFVLTLFMYPDLYSEVAYRWIRSMPFTTLILCASVAVGVYTTKSKKWTGDSARTFQFFAGLLVALMFLITIFPQPYAAIRYTYFLYPLFLLSAVGAWFGFPWLSGMSSRRQSVLLMSVAILFCAISEDVNITYIRNIATPEILFRTSMSKWQTDVVYRRWDYETPAEFVNQHIGADDKVITTMHSVPFYLDRLDYMYHNETSDEFLVIAACGGRKELWSNAGLVYKEDKFRNLVWDRSFGTWLIIRAPGRAEAQPIEDTISQSFENSLQYMSLDNRIAVYYLPKQAPE